MAGTGTTSTRGRYPGRWHSGSCVCESEGGTVEFSRQLLTVQERQLAARVLVVYKCGVTQHVTGASQDTGARSFTAEHERLGFSRSYAQQMSTFTVERRCLTTRRRLRLIRPSQVRTHVRTHLSKGRPQQAKVMVSVFVCAPRSSVARAHRNSQSVWTVSLRFVQPRGAAGRPAERRSAACGSESGASFRHPVTLSPIRGCGPSEQPASLFCLL